MCAVNNARISETRRAERKGEREGRDVAGTRSVGTAEKSGGRARCAKPYTPLHEDTRGKLKGSGERGVQKREREKKKERNSPPGAANIHLAISRLPPARRGESAPQHSLTPPSKTYCDASHGYFGATNMETGRGGPNEQRATWATIARQRRNSSGIQIARRRETPGEMEIEIRR